MSDDKLIDLLVQETFRKEHTGTHPQTRPLAHFELLSKLNCLPIDIYQGQNLHKDFVRFRISGYDFDVPISWINPQAPTQWMARKKENDEHFLIKIISHHLGKNLDTFFVAEIETKFFLLLWDSKAEGDLEQKIISEFKKFSHDLAA
jgi:hypothetical protein